MNPIERTLRAAGAALLVLAAALPQAHANPFVVNEDGSAVDVNTAVASCVTSNGGCSLHAAIQQANALPGSHTITFSIPSVTLTASLPPINNPTTIDGAFGAPRVEIIGNAATGGFDIQASAGGVAPGSGTTLRNLVIRNMQGNGISIVGGGNAVSNCYIGTDAGGTVAQANGGHGIAISSVAGPVFGIPPDFTGIGSNFIGNPADPTSGNLVSGNNSNGIDISGQRTVLTVVAFNKVGTDNTGLLAIPNGQHGVQVSGDSFANAIGPFNIISGNNGVNSDGINISGTVRAPNVITTNIIGPASGLILNVGNGRSGIRVDSSLASIAVPEGATIGPLNIIGYNGEDGILITGNSERIRVFGNFIGVAEDPATAGSILDLGNARDGIHITTSGHQIGGASLPETNVIAANSQSGIFLNPGVNRTRIQGNIIGRDPFNLINFPNGNDGITLLNSGGNTIGGTGAGEGNVIAGNARHGIKITSGGNGWSNLITRNSIFGNGPAVLPAVPPGNLGIDLDFFQEAVDPTDNVTPGPDPNLSYANYGQNAPVISTGLNAPSFNPGSGATTVTWTLDTSPTTPITLEFFGNDVAGFQAHGEGKTYLGTTTTTTDAFGQATGSTAVSPASPYDARGKFITMTATSTIIVPSGTIVDFPPGSPIPGPANNTSEFSNAVSAPNPGSLQFSLAAYSISEAGGTATITVTRTGGSDGSVSVDYATSDGSATQPADYGAAGATLTWADADAASKTFTVSIVDDNIRELNETVNTALSNATGGAAIGVPSSAILTITDNDPIPSISMGDVALPEGNSGLSPFVFTVALSNPSSQTVTVNYTTADGSAAAGTDYVATSGTLTFNPGVTTQTITVNVNGDTTDEPDETFTVNLSVPVNATIAMPSATGTIQNDDAAAPTFSIDSVTQAEGNAGTSAFTFTVTLTPAAGVAVSVQAATANGTATVADGDYVANTQTLNFAAGVSAQTFTVLVNGDTRFEPNETFIVNLSANSVGTAVSPTPGTGTITSDDPIPSISSGSVTLSEGNAGFTPFVFTVTLSNPSSQVVTVNFASANGTAAAGLDYVANSGTLTFNPGVTSQAITVNVIGDTTNEPDETFTVNLSVPVNATIATPSATGTITNDDPLPAISITDVAALEGNAATTPFVFTVTLSNASSLPVMVNFATANGTATAGSDYTAASGTLTFNPGVTSQTITVNVTGDTTNEADETFTVNLTVPVNATFAKAAGLGTIQNDDSTTPTFAINGVTQAEGNAGTTAFVFTVTLAPAAAVPVSVQAATADGTATLADADYVATTQTLNFATGATTRTITVLVNGDAKFEPSEAFTVNLGANSVGTAISPTPGTGTITNDDVQPAISIGDVAALEGNAGLTPFVFNVTLSNASSLPVTVAFATVNGTATAGSDFAAAGGTLTFNPGVTTQSITVNVNGDATNEADETFTVVLSAPTNATLAKASGLATIQNDDSTTPTFNINSVSLAEGNAGTTAFVFMVTLAPAAATPVTVQAATADGTATVAGGDYAASMQTLTFAAGVTSQTFTVLVNGDTLPEANETFTVVLTANSAGTAVSPTPGTGTITNDDVAGALTITTPTVIPGATLGSPFSLALTAVGGTPPYVSWVVIAGSLPPLLTLGPATGVLSGTPTTLAGNPFAFTVQVTDNVGGTTTKAFTLAVNPGPACFSGPSATGSGTVQACVTGGGPTCTFASGTAQLIPLTGNPLSPPAGTAPAGIIFPHALFAFELAGCTPGSTATLTVTYPGVLPPGTQYYKYGPQPPAIPAGWYVLPATIAGNTATFTIVDGGLGDDDLIANGTIVDQGGPGFPGAGAIPVPTLSEWAMVLLAALVLLVANGRVRRRRP